MNQALNEAFARRETEQYKLVRLAFTEVVEKLAKILDQDPKVFAELWKLYLDNAALAAAQLGVTKKQFMEWADESWELYSRIAKEATGNPDRAHRIGEMFYENIEKK